MNNCGEPKSCCRLGYFFLIVNTVFFKNRHTRVGQAKQAVVSISGNDTSRAFKSKVQDSMDSLGRYEEMK